MKYLVVVVPVVLLSLAFVLEFRTWCVLFSSFSLGVVITFLWTRWVLHALLEQDQRCVVCHQDVRSDPDF